MVATRKQATALGVYLDHRCRADHLARYTYSHFLQGLDLHSWEARNANDYSNVTRPQYWTGEDESLDLANARFCSDLPDGAVILFGSLGYFALVAPLFVADKSYCRDHWGDLLARSCLCSSVGHGLDCHGTAYEAELDDSDSDSVCCDRCLSLAFSRSNPSCLLVWSHCIESCCLVFSHSNPSRPQVFCHPNPF